MKAKGIIDKVRGGGKFIKAAVPPERKGIFRGKAKAAGESTAQYAKQEAGAKGKLGKEARLAETLMGLPKRGKK